MAYEKSDWRLIITPPAPGAWNMALDEAILEAAARRDVLPTLRLYAWEPACLSLGYAQPYADVDRAALAAHGWDVVRRPTGGRAILHTDELTYSVAGPQDEPRLVGSVLESYRVLAEALLQALHHLSIPAQAAEKSSAPEGLNTNPVCFETPSSYEITVQGKKLVGSAQSRRIQGVLQHGSLPLHGDLTRITRALAFPDESARQAAAERLLAHACHAESALGYAPSWQAAAAAFQAAFAESLNLDLQPGELSVEERARAEVLVGEKYGHSSWTERV